MAQETWVQSQVESYQRLRKWYLMLPCLTLCIIRYESRLKWSNPGKGVAPSPTPWCSSYRKWSLRVTLNCCHQLYLIILFTPVGLGCGIHHLHLGWRVKLTHPNKCPGYDIKLFDGEAPALEIWGMWSTPLLPLLPDPLWLEVVSPDRALSMGQMQTNNWC